MDFSNTRELSDDDKEKITNWLTTYLSKVMEESDDVFLEYVMVMIVNGKTMQEISVDMEAFIGEPACTEFALSLGEFLQTLSPDSPKQDDSKADSIADDEETEKKSSTKSKIINLSSSSKKNLPPLKSGRIPNSEDSRAKMSGALKSNRPGDKKGGMSGALSAGRGDKKSRIVQDALKSMEAQDGDRNKRRSKGNQNLDDNDNYHTNKRRRNENMNSQPPSQPQLPNSGGNMESMFAAYQQNMMQMMMQMMDAQNQGQGTFPGSQFTPNNFNNPYGGYGGGRGGKGAGRGGRGYMRSGRGPPPPPPPEPVSTTEPNLSNTNETTEELPSEGGAGNNSTAPDDYSSSGKGKGFGRGGKGYHGWSHKGGRGRGYKGGKASWGTYEHKTWVRPTDGDSEQIEKQVE